MGAPARCCRRSRSGLHFPPHDSHAVPARAGTLRGQSVDQCRGIFWRITAPVRAALELNMSRRTRSGQGGVGCIMCLMAMMLAKSWLTIPEPLQHEHTDRRCQTDIRAARRVDFAGKGIQRLAVSGGNVTKRGPEFGFEGNAGAMPLEGKGMLLWACAHVSIQNFRVGSSSATFV